MTALPTRTDRMPQSTEEMLPVEHVIALALNSVAHEWWKHGRVSETSEPVRQGFKGAAVCRLRGCAEGEGKMKALNQGIAGFVTIPSGHPRIPAPLAPNEIEVVYMQHLNSGTFYLPQLGRAPISIEDWKAQQLERWVGEGK